MFARAALASMFCAASGAVFAHRAPHSLVKFDFLPQGVNAELLVPESELAFATAAEPEIRSLTAYLLRHVKAETSDGTPWTVEVRAVRKLQYLEHAYLSAALVLAPPKGASAQSFVLVDDAVTHEVRNHVIMVLVNTTTTPELRGLLQYPARRIGIERSTRK